MTQNIISWTPSVCEWLEQILSERFGHRFELDAGARSQETHLRLTGYEGFIAVKSSVDIFSRADSSLAYTEWAASEEGWDEILGTPLPVPGEAVLMSPLIERRTDSFYIHYDIFGLAYWMLSRQEEVGRTDLDKYGRFPAVASHAFKHNYLERPVVDEWLNVLGQVIQRQWPNVSLVEHQFSMRVSHDVDSPSMYGFKPWKTIFRMMAGHAIKRRDLKEFFNAPRIRLNSTTQLHPNDPFNTFEWLMQESEDHGLASAFYFICGRTDAMRDADYEIEHPAIRRLMKRIHERGHEIGLHPSFNSYRSSLVIKTEAERLKRVCAAEGIDQTRWGGRMHYLRWEHPTTMQAWAEAGLDYDSTLGYADHPGFRCGTCHEYPAFNPVDEKALSLRIRPLIIMEGTIIGSHYMNLGVSDKAFDKMRDIKLSCEAVGGNFNFLWHNSQLDTLETKLLYRKVLR